MKTIELKKQAGAEAEQLMPQLNQISRFIYENPELAFAEKKACQKLTAVLEEHGFHVEKNVGGLETAFTATYQQGENEIGRKLIGIAAEYDALPDLGHGCGHNLIAASSLGAALVLKKVMETTGLEGELRVIGTPAEEDGGGKILLLEKGVFDGLSMCMMMHPTSGVTRIAGRCLSSHGMAIRWQGKSAHAESHPEEGVNALDALHIYYTAIACLRQQLPDDVRIAQIITDGGRNEGMIPDSASISVDIVSQDQNLQATIEKVQNCAKGAAIAAGCDCEIEHITGYLGRRPNQRLAQVFRDNFEIIGEPLMDGMPEDFGTTDFGNVMRKVPSCNPYVSLLPSEKISNHTERFKELAMAPRAEQVIEISVKAMAYSAIDLLTDPMILKAAWHEFLQEE
ncbi:MAG: M20 family metallopeptidase [Firmicutes bacterium]|nr:M20 family metallopeptidase [Bacillota bacterium]